MIITFNVYANKGLFHRVFQQEEKFQNLPPGGIQKIR